MEQLKELFTVIFFIDQQPPTKLVLLKRASSRYGGDLYTGIGGHFEPAKDPNIQISAERELEEEVPEWAGIPILEFARCIVNSQKELFYFWGMVDSSKPLPPADEREGQISWVSIEDIFNLNIFPTTRPVLEEWQQRGFRVDKPWTMYVTGQEDQSGVTRAVVVDRIEEVLNVN